MEKKKKHIKQKIKKRGEKLGNLESPSQTTVCPDICSCVPTQKRPWQHITLTLINPHQPSVTSSSASLLKFSCSPTNTSMLVLLIISLTSLHLVPESSPAVLLTIPPITAITMKRNFRQRAKCHVLVTLGMYTFSVYNFI